MKKEIKKTVSAGGIVRKLINNKMHIALIKEADMPSYSWVLPKGHVGKNETIEQAAIREAREETGLDKMEIIQKLGVKQRLSFEQDEQKTIHYFLFNCSDSKEVNIAEDEGKIMKVKWFSLDNLPKLFWEEQKEIINDNLNIIKRY